MLPGGWMLTRVLVQVFCLLTSLQAANLKTGTKIYAEWTPQFKDLAKEKADLSAFNELVRHSSELDPDQGLVASNILGQIKNNPALEKTPVGPVWNPDLSDEELVHYRRMAKWSAASYCSQDSLMSWSCGPRCEGITHNTHVALYFKTSVTDTVGFIATYTDVEKMEDQIIIAFRGSLTFQNWIENLRFVKEPSPWPDRDYPGARVHTGFLDSYADIATTLRSSVMVLGKRYPNARIVITGHSLGGAIATLCAADLKYHLGMTVNIELVSFHSPRVGNSQFCGFIDKYFQSSQVNPELKMEYMTRRFTNRDDPLCHLPPMWLEFQHINQEVWINFDNKAQACDPAVGEDPNCSDSILMPDGLDSHFYIWNVFFGPDCSN